MAWTSTMLTEQTHGRTHARASTRASIKNVESTQCNGLPGQAPAMTTLRAYSPAGLRVAHLQRAHRAADGEVAIVQHQGARHAVLVEFELDGIDRRLLAALLAAVEIADGDRPARHVLEHAFAGGGVIRLALARRDRAADDGERVVELLSGLGAVVDRQLQHRLAVARRRHDAADVLGREHDSGIHVE